MNIGNSLLSGDYDVAGSEADDLHHPRDDQCALFEQSKAMQLGENLQNVCLQTIL